MIGTTIWLTTGGSAIGALARYGVGRFVGRCNRSAFPWGTWLINGFGTALFGIFAIAFAQNAPSLFLLLGAGFCGGFTTFSALSLETATLFRANRLLSLAYLVSSLGIGLVVAWLVQLWL
ncbi:camphor resistance protein CrcB [Alicyclobacillus sacchari]|uniref:Fluoride-specific ion channel FluC n=1 Tax=Alicyclobacillus sacchari TaxID=392010 RepID=A0A4R8LIJ1_9BACL|nr:CrcB family protein [Alicyclobacillus sacchari]TDY43050.1 camphor resistance protein CrcB [Alicyclobacillus sacchari]GMA57775.1 putative fluoride ion transporter CrcB 1 [Alicyclobacillus sacchari]